jgi:hypothetical protein
MLYPCEAAIIGANPPEGSKERYEVREHRGAEFLKVKLKVSLLMGLADISSDRQVQSRGRT